MSTPEQEERQMNDPGSCSRDCIFRGTSSCSFESCPFDEHPINQGGDISDVCEICGKTITRNQLSNTPVLCETCKSRLKFLLVDNWSTLRCLVSSGGYQGYCK